MQKAINPDRFASTHAFLVGFADGYEAALYQPELFGLTSNKEAYKDGYDHGKAQYFHAFDCKHCGKVGGH